MAWVTQNTKIKRVNYQNKTDNDNHKWVYNTDRWRKIRINYLMQHPLCQICINKQIPKIVAAIDIHHKTAISTAKTKYEKQKLGFDIKNLLSVCSDCHKEIHRNKYLLENDYDKLW